MYRLHRHHHLKKNVVGLWVFLKLKILNKIKLLFDDTADHSERY